ncbi:hypothetical protein P21_00056 [Clostridium phage P21]|nr:hypothetical protein P21_00056 [Clostridium phage P21]
MQLIVVQGDKSFDITNTSSGKSWAGSSSSAPRTLSFQYNAQDIHPIYDGDQVVLVHEGKNIFNGIIMNISDSEKKHLLKVKAYDPMIYWANNKDSFVFENQTGEAIFESLCKAFGVAPGVVAKTGYTFSSLVCEKQTPYDIMKKVIKEVYEQTGEQFYIYYNSITGKFDFINRRTNNELWKFEYGKNIGTFSRSRNFDSIVNQVKLVCKYKQGKGKDDPEITLFASAKDDSSQKKYGVFQLYDTISDELNQAQLNEKARIKLETGKRPKTDISITVIGVPDCISGKAIVVSIPHLKINKAFYIESDTHKFDTDYTMNLKLKCTEEGDI